MPISITGANGDDQRLTMTLKLWLQNNLEDQFFGQHALFRKLKELKRIVTGGLGTEIVVPTKYPAAGGPVAEGVSDPYAARSHSPMTGITSLKYTAAEYMMPISAPVRELKLQGSLTKKVDYLQSVMEIAMDRFMDKLRTDMWASESNADSAGSATQLASIRTLLNKGGTSATSPYSPAALPSQVSSNVNSLGWTSGAHGVAAVDTGTAVYSVGGINRNAAGNAYFCTPLLNPSSSATLSRFVINNLITLATRNTDRGDLGILTSGHYDALMGLLQSQRQLQDSKLTEYGFDAFTWRGVDWVFDDDCPTAAPGYNAFVINTKALKFMVDSMEPDVQQSEDSERPIKVWKASWFGQLCPTKLGRGLGARHANLAAPAAITS